MSGYTKRSNLWCCVIYPEDSLPDNYKQIIQKWHIPVLLSPVHDCDINADDTEKKKHIHVMLDFGSGQNKSFDQVRQMTDELKGSIPIICHNKFAMIRYFVHKDNPEKHQYRVEDLVSISGFEYDKAFDTYTNEIELYKYIENIVYTNMIYNYAILVKYMSDHNLIYELQFLRKHTYHFKALLDGYFQLITSGRQKIVDNDESVDKYIE